MFISEFKYIFELKMQQFYVSIFFYTMYTL